MGFFSKLRDIFDLHAHLHHSTKTAWLTRPKTHHHIDYSLIKFWNQVISINWNHKWKYIVSKNMHMKFESIISINNCFIYKLRFSRSHILRMHVIKITSRVSTLMIFRYVIKHPFCDSYAPAKPSYTFNLQK